MKYHTPTYALRDVTAELDRCLWRGRLEGAVLLCLVILIIGLLIDRARTPEAPAPRPAVQQHVQPVRPEVEEGLEPSDLRTQPQG